MLDHVRMHACAVVFLAIAGRGVLLQEADPGRLRRRPRVEYLATFSWSSKNEKTE